MDEMSKVSTKMSVCVAREAKSKLFRTKVVEAGRSRQLLEGVRTKCWRNTDTVA